MKANLNSKFWGGAALGLAVLTLGMSAIFVKLADAPGTTTSFYRVLIALVTLAVPLGLLAPRFPPAKPSKKNLQVGRTWALFGGLFFAIDLALWSTGVELCGAVVPTVLTNTAPLWVGLFLFVIWKQKLSKSFFVGISLSLIGIVLFLKGSSIQFSPKGVTLSALSGAFYAAFFICVQKARQHLSATTVACLTNLAAAASLFLLLVFSQGSMTGSSPFFWVSVLSLGVLIQLVGGLSLNFALGHFPAQVVSPVLLLQPIVTALFASLLFQEHLTLSQWGFSVLIIAGVLFSQQSQQRTPSYQTPHPVPHR